MNLSKVRARRFWLRWESAGALSTISGPVPSYRQILNHLSNENHLHTVMISRVMYAIQWLPDAVLTMDNGITREQVQSQTIYWQIGLLHRVSNTESAHGLLPEGMLVEINHILEEIATEGFRTANDSLSRCHPEMQLGEAWLCNADDEGWESISFQSKRCGVIAYSRWHDPVDGLFPVFVRRDEYVARGSPGALAR